MIRNIIDIVNPKRNQKQEDKDLDPNPVKEISSILKSSNRLKHSFNRNSNKEDELKPQVISRKDQVTTEFKIISYCLINLLGNNKMKLLKLCN